MTWQIHADTVMLARTQRHAFVDITIASVKRKSKIMFFMIIDTVLILWNLSDIMII